MCHWNTGQCQTTSRQVTAVAEAEHGHCSRAEASFFELLPDWWDPSRPENWVAQTLLLESSEVQVLVLHASEVVKQFLEPDRK